MHTELEVLPKFDIHDIYEKGGLWDAMGDMSDEYIMRNEKWLMMLVQKTRLCM